MIKKLSDLSIGQSFFVIAISIVAIMLLLSTGLTNQLVFSRTDRLIETTSKEINKQVIMNYENYLSSVIDISNTMQKYIVDLTKTNEIDKLSELLVATTNLERNIKHIALLDDKGMVIAASTPLTINPHIQDIDWF